VVHHYQEDPLASGPEDEKEIDRAESRAEKDAKKEAERGATKRPRGGGSHGHGANNKRWQLQYREPYWNEPLRQSGGYYNRREHWGPQKPFKLKVLGPRFQCGAYGHIARFCNGPRRPYPFMQNHYLLLAQQNLCYIVKCADGCEGMNNVCVNEVTLVHHGTVKESVDWPSVEHASGHMYGDQVAWRDGTTQFWELESYGSVQITDVQGRLKKCLPF